MSESVFGNSYDLLDDIVNGGTSIADIARRGQSKVLNKSGLPPKAIEKNIENKTNSKGNIESKKSASVSVEQKKSAIIENAQKKPLSASVEVKTSPNTVVRKRRRRVGTSVQENKQTMVKSASEPILSPEKITKAKTIKNGRLTEPKKRSLLRRVMLQMKYERNAYDWFEDDYYNGDISQEELEKSKNAKKRSERELYKEVQEYEDAAYDVTVRKGWMRFRLGLAAVMLSGALMLGYNTVKDIKDTAAARNPAIVTIDTASEEQIEAAENKLDIVISSSEYSFKNLSTDEQIDAILRIPAVVKKFNENTFRGYFLRFEDQEMLEVILEKTFGEEYSAFSNAQKADLMKLTYELLPEEKQQYIRDPEVVANLQKEKQGENVQSGTASQNLTNNNQDEMEIGD